MPENNLTVFLKVFGGAAMLLGGGILFTALALTAPAPPRPPLEHLPPTGVPPGPQTAELFAVTTKGRGIWRFHDHTTGATCYTSGDGLTCVQPSCDP